MAIAILLPFVLAFAPPPLPAAPGPPERITTGSLLAPVADHLGVDTGRLSTTHIGSATTGGSPSGSTRIAVLDGHEEVAFGYVSGAGDTVISLVFSTIANERADRWRRSTDPPTQPKRTTTEVLCLATKVRDDFLTTPNLPLELTHLSFDGTRSWNAVWQRRDDHGVPFHQDHVAVGIYDEVGKPERFASSLLSLPPPGSPPPDPPAEFPDPVTTRWEGEITDFFRVMASNEKSNPLRDGRKPRITFHPGKRAIVTPNRLFRLPVSLPVEIVLERPIPAPSSYAYVVPFEILMPGSWSPFQCELWVDPGTLRVIGGVI